MSFDREALVRAVAARERIARVVIARVEGSAPREAGTSMLVWPGGQEGTIGGGTLEYEAAARARAALAEDRGRLDRAPLGPALGQCCGGAVVLVTEIWDRDRLAAATGDVLARALPGGPGAMPLSVRRLLARARDRGVLPEITLKDGWIVEAARPPARALWVFGAGHVGRAIVGILSPLPDLAVTWVDAGPERFPDPAPDGVTILPAANPADAVRLAPADAEHLVLTYSHAFDLEICHRLLGQQFRSAGLIGSATKWARFRSRLRQLGHSEASIARIRCPIGEPGLGKHPQAIAVGVARDILLGGDARAARKDGTG